MALKTVLLGSAIAAFLGAFTATAAGAAGADYQLRILHVNDVHARYDQITATGGFCTPKDEAEKKCIGGAARLQTKLKELRGDNALFLDAGDQFQGTLFYTQYKHGAVQTVLGMLNPDAQTLGNHEFDDGPAGLRPYLDAVSWPVLSANTDTSREPRLKDRYKPYTIVVKNGQRIGIVGLTTADTPITSSPGPTVAFRSEAQALTRAVAALRARNVDKIVALTHIGYSEDQALAAQIDGVDVYVGGHSHTFLETGNDKAAGPYPTVVKTPSGAPALVVQAGSYGTHLGMLDVTFDSAGVVTAWEGKPVALSNDVALDAAVADKVSQLNVPLAQLRRQPVGEARVELVGTSDACRFGECNLGNLIADAMLWATRGQGTQISIQNGGGIRSGIPAGRVSMGNVIEVLPFSNTLATFDVTGADLLASLESGVSRAHDKTTSGTGRFPQVAGLRYAFDPAKPEGARISSVEIRDAGGAYRPVDPSATYKAVTNNFVRTGGDGYGLFAKAKNAYDYGPNLETVVSEYIRTTGPVAPAVEGRIRRVQ
ncbi:multifunctional 2',3'-cyclic-nucleotide 2'-phosphodiesterase/5'-nucleotidase/3'-nucleotidase [Skermanella aerolata]|uniref:Multifunctional 2',3'-cyclic-nucleotide 2'-phosphodiesterase/5'-nucleotidase/3'-nucleotidase n=1 Tax=Skermanella aerolata TaxID=393310 RepID=A0A512DQB2_9PROT|nr:multifunctional 2',3'-cyclic-nucleotide 2'-phosphodiesterase/5'-nucleotidase/3'-nucleotidase [Skermanella aerolata]